MNVTLINDPIAGEHIVGVSPTMSPNVGDSARRRMHLFSGRTLSDTALRLEQEHRSDHLATLGRRLSPGVVSGLEVAFDNSGDPAREWDIHVGSGSGIAASGEDIVLPKATVFNLLKLQVYGPQALVAKPTTSAPTPVPKNVWAPGTPYVLGDSFENLMKRKVILPHVGILVLQPIVGHFVGKYDDSDPCNQSAQGYAFEDWRITDGCRLLLHLWPKDRMPLPLENDPRLWRNYLAYKIFDYEGQGKSRRLLPWDELGVPVGLVGIGRGFTPSVMDRAAVVRAGGKLERRSILVSGSGSSRLWHARIDQFNNQIIPMIKEELPAEQAATHFRWLPPVGFLPKDAIDLHGGRSHFFPSHFNVEAVPIPDDQLDVATKASASLAPYDTDVADKVRVLVPVPSAFYEPSLLIEERVAPEFRRVINQNVSTCQLSVSHRENVRAKRSLLTQAATGKPKQYPHPDPERVPGEKPTITLSENAEEAFGTKLADDGKTRLVQEVVDIKAYLEAGNVLSANEVLELDRRGLKGFISYLKAKVNRADDTVDLGFVRVQANIYRIRQFMLGSEAASRLATSPALASIATGDSAEATRKDVAEFVERVSYRKPSDGGTESEGTLGDSSDPPPEDDPSILRGPEDSADGSVRSVGDSSDPPPEDGLSILRGPQGSAGRIVRVFEDSIPPTTLFGRQPSPEKIKLETGGKVLLGQKQPSTKEDVTGQTEIIGKDYDRRTMTIAMRLAESPARESKSQGVAITYETIKNLTKLDINFGDDAVIRLPVEDDDPDGKYDDHGRPRREETKLSDLQSDRTKLERILKDPDPKDGDEAAYFSDSVDVLDGVIGSLRRVEGVVQGYKDVIEQCKSSLKTVESFVDKADDRLDTIGNVLIEVRHDILVAQSLLKDEIARVGSINERRSGIIDRHVRYLAYHRPRSVDTSSLRRCPVWTLDPDIAPELVPSCLECKMDIPSELEAMVNLYRDLPIKWFPRILHLVGSLRKFSAVYSILMSSKTRSEGRYKTLSFEEKSVSSKGTPMEAFAKVYAVHRQNTIRYIQQLVMIDLPSIPKTDWLQCRDWINKSATVGDLIDSNHGSSSVARRAIEELDAILHVAGHLYQKFDKVSPALRLNWVTVLSQYDTPENLRNLASLARWGEVDYTERKEMQSMVDWLYLQVDTCYPEAVALISDLVRVCILVSSHAPVNKISTGRVSAPTSVVPGGLVPLKVDTARLAIGQAVLMYSADKVAAKGIVENIQAGQATARILTMETEVLNFDQKTLVQIGTQLPKRGPAVSGSHTKKGGSELKFRSSKRGRRR